MTPTKQQALLRLVNALSGACRADSNVLKDAQLVDLLESQAKAILQSRREKKKQMRQQQQTLKQQTHQTLKQPRRASATTSSMASCHDAPTISPLRNKLIQKLAAASSENDKSSSASKRRKLSFETVTQQQQQQQQQPMKPQRIESPVKAPLSRHTPNKAASTSTTVDSEDCSDKHSMASPIESPSKSESIASVATTTSLHSSPLSVFRAGVVDHLLARSCSDGRVSPPPFYKARAAFKSLDEASVTNGGTGIDLSASMASTVASTSAEYYDELCDELSGRSADSPGADSRGRRTPLTELTQSVDSIDWSPSDDEEDNGELLTLAHGATTPLSVADVAVAVPSAVVNSTEAVMHVLFGVLLHDAKYKWLVDPSNQMRVAKLVAFHQQEQEQEQQQQMDDNVAVAETADLSLSPQSEPQHDISNNASSVVALRAQVDALVRENAQLAAANALSASDVEAQQQRVTELVAQLRAATNAVDAATTAERVATVSTDSPTAAPSESALQVVVTQQQEALAAQTAMRREAEAAFAAQLLAKSECVALLQQDAAAKDAEVAQLMAHVAALTSASDNSRNSSATAASSMIVAHLRDVNVAREREVQRLRSVLAAKDRELCALYMQLSTKTTLVDELAQRVAQTLQQSPSRLSNPQPTLDVDTFLFASAMAKQQAVDELTAALGVMEREVETLEARVETLESDNYRLTVTHDDTASTLESANAELLRVSAENELMESSLADKQTRIRNLMLYLEEKEEQIMRLKDAAEQTMGRAPRTF